MRFRRPRHCIERPDSIIVATVSAIYGLGDPQAYLSMVLHLVRGEPLDQRKLLRRLATCSTHATSSISRRARIGAR